MNNPKSKEDVFALSQIEGVGNRFCSSYPYETASEKFKKEYGMTEYTIEQLEELRK